MRIAPSLLVEKRADRRDGLRGLFFHYPMARIVDDAASHIARDEAQVIGQLSPEGVVGIKRQDRDGKLSLGREFPVVDRVLRERRELIEGRMNCPGTRVELGIMPARRLVREAG
jgi:hypothetical protein